MSHTKLNKSESENNNRNENENKNDEENNNMKNISFFFCILALMLTKFLWENKSKFGDIKNSPIDNNNDQNDERLGLFYSNLSFEFLQVIFFLPFFIFIIKSENEKLKNVEGNLRNKDRIGNIINTNSVERIANSIISKNKQISIDNKKSETEHMITNEDKNEKTLYRSISNYTSLNKLNIYSFSFITFYISRITLIIYWNLDLNSRIAFPFLSQILNSIPSFTLARIIKWHLILPNIIISNCLINFIIVVIIILHQKLFDNKTKINKNRREIPVNLNKNGNENKFENKNSNKNDMMTENDFFSNTINKEQDNLFLIFILFCHFSVFYSLALGSRSAPILSIVLLLFICLAISFVIFYLRYNDKDNNNDNQNSKNKDVSKNIKNEIQIRINNNNEKNSKYLEYNFSNRIKLKKNLLLAAFIFHIAMLSRLLFFISGHNFDFGSLQVRYNNL